MVTRETKKQYFERICYLYFIQNKSDEAITVADELISLDSEDANSYHTRALIYFFQYKYDLALDDLNHALTINPDDEILAKIYETRARIFFLRDELDKALADCDHLIRIETENVLAYCQRGKIYTAKMLVEAYLESARVLILNEDYETAVQYLVKSRETNNEAELAWYNLYMYGKVINESIYALHLNSQNEDTANNIDSELRIQNVTFQDFFKVVIGLPSEIAIHFLIQCLDESALKKSLDTNPLLASKLKILENLLAALKNSYTNKVLPVFKDKQSTLLTLPEDVSNFIAQQYAEVTSLKSAYKFFASKQTKNDEEQHEDRYIMKREVNY